MLSFENDYSQGALPQVLEALVRSNSESLPGYGEDSYCSLAREKILAACACPQGALHFLTGGTQINAVVLAALLRPWEGVVTPSTGHINGHEAGAPEALGCKLLPLPGRQGKLDPAELRAYVRGLLADENLEHMVYPGLVYLSHPTEWGTLYSREELEAIAAVCREFGLRLYLDGARLAYGLAAEPELDLPLLARLCDAFTIGGTKCGALCGEAVVFPKGAPAHFPNFIKKHGAMLAKGRLLGVQFDALFTDGCYLEAGRRGIAAARALKRILRAHGAAFHLETPTNQQFLRLTQAQYEALRERVRVGFWCRLPDGDLVVRFATAWYSTQAELEALDRVLGELWG